MILPRLPVLFMFRLDYDGRMSFRKYFLFEGNVLDLAILKDDHRIIYSLDHYHVSSSTTKVAGIEALSSRPMMGSISLEENDRWAKTSMFEEALREVINGGEADEPLVDYLHQRGQLIGELLYSRENLRKQGQEEHG